MYQLFELEIGRTMFPILSFRKKRGVNKIPIDLLRKKSAQNDFEREKKTNF